MPRLPALTLISALLLVLSLNTAPVAANVSPLRLSHRGGEHARMMRRYAQQGAVARGLLDDIDTGSTDTDTPGATPTPSASHDGGLGGAIGTAIGGGGHSTTDSAESTPTVTATSSSTKDSASSSETTTTRTRASTTPQSTPTPKSSSTSTTATRPTRTVFTPGQTLTPEQQQEVDDNREKQSTLSRISPNVRVGLIVAASVLAGLLIIWTAVRRWKLRSSRSFQARLAPIDWQPDSDKDHTGAGGSGLVPPAPMTEVSDKASIRHNMFAPDGQQSLAPPPHDFTAVPGGYSRSGSPMPNPYGRTPSPAPFSNIPRTDSPAPVGGLQRYPSNGSGHGSNGYGGYEHNQHGGYEQHQHGGYDPNVHRGY